MSPAAILTTSWDDGSPEDLAVAELLNRFGFLGTFYATTGPSGHRTITDSALRQVAELGHELGNHGQTHRTFVELSHAEILEEVAWGTAEIERFATPSRIVAPPRGVTTRNVIRLLNEEGLTVRTAPILGGRARPGVMVPTAQVFPHDVATTVRHLLWRRTLPATPYLRAWARSGSVRARLTEILSARSRKASVLHFWGHSEEIDRLGLWADLEFVLEQAAASGLSAATNGDLLAGLPA